MREKLNGEAHLSDHGTKMLHRHHAECTYEIGLDEAGRGPLFGPVVAAAVVLPADADAFDLTRMRDSKKIKSPKKMAELATYIQDHALAYSVQYADHEVIDRINILQADMQCMHACVRDILPRLPSTDVHLLVDGNYFKPFAWYQDATDTWVNVPHHCAIKGDATYASVAAASILAKHARDQWVLALCREHPDLVDKYGLDTNMGYGTKRHMDGIAEHGLSPWHRRSFHLKNIPSN